jgi:hypothetical protein
LILAAYAIWTKLAIKWGHRARNREMDGLWTTVLWIGVGAVLLALFVCYGVFSAARARTHAFEAMAATGGPDQKYFETLVKVFKDVVVATDTEGVSDEDRVRENMSVSFQRAPDGQYTIYLRDNLHFGGLNDIGYDADHESTVALALMLRLVTRRATHIAQIVYSTVDHDSTQQVSYEVSVTPSEYLERKAEYASVGKFVEAHKHVVHDTASGKVWRS